MGLREMQELLVAMQQCNEVQNSEELKKKQTFLIDRPFLFTSYSLNLNNEPTLVGRADSPPLEHLLSRVKQECSSAGAVHVLQVDIKVY